MGRNSGGAQGVPVATVILLLVAVGLLGRCSGQSSRLERDAAPAPAVVERAALTPAPVPLPEPIERRYVDAETLNYRATPNGQMLGKLARGTEVSVQERDGGWLKVSAGPSREGWVAERYTCASVNCWHRVAATPVRPARVAPQNFGSSCPCSGSNNCFGPRGGRYCITKGGNKRYR